MKGFAQSRALRLPVVVIAALGWFSLSNHCALAAIEGAAKTPMHCHGSAAPTKAPSKHDQDNGVECCKIVRATLLTPAKDLVSLDQLLYAPFKYLVAVIVLPDAGEQNGVFEWDTGPPGVDSFAESVLQRSILAHAPPSVA